MSVHLLGCIDYMLLFFIEPDLGMEPGLAHHFFSQLIAGMVSSLRKYKNFNKEPSKDGGIKVREQE